MNFRGRIPASFLPFALLVAVLFLLVPAPVRAQEEPAVQKSLRRIEDETAPLSFRVIEVDRLLQLGDPLGLDGLRRILGGSDRPVDLRLAVLLRAVAHPGVALFDDVLGVLLAEREGELAKRAVAGVRFLGAPGFVRRLEEAAKRSDLEEPRRLLAIDLLGSTGGKLGVSALLRIWETGGDPWAEKAREALFDVIPVRFASVGDAQAFWEANSARDLEEILRGIIRSMDDGERPGQGRPRLVEFAEQMLDSAPVAKLAGAYLASETADVRTMGARRLASYPYAEREGDAGLKEAVAGLVRLLAKEEDRTVEAEALRALRALVEKKATELPEDAFAQVSRRLSGADRETQVAAAVALGALRDPRAIELLETRYDQLGPEDPEFRLAVLEALEKIGDGIAAWLHEKLRAGDPEEAIAIRLIQLLEKYPEHRESIPTLIGLLRAGKASDKVRREAASTLGTIGVTAGDAEAVQALGVHGLVDADPSVRVISATQLGRVKGEMEGKVVDFLRMRLGEAETVPRVRMAAARSLLKLRRADAVADLGDRLKDDEFWKEGGRSYLSAELVATGDAAEAARFVRALTTAGLPHRCAEAARLVLSAGNLKWEGPAEGGRGEVAFDLAASLGVIEKPEEALEVLAKEVPAKLPADPTGIRRGLLQAQLLRKAGRPAEAIEVMKPWLSGPTADPADRAQASLETARAMLDRGTLDGIDTVLAPALESPRFADRARVVLEAVRERRAAEGPPPPPPPATPKPEELIPALDDADPARRDEAAARLTKMGQAAWPALLEWLRGKTAEALPAALGAVLAITGLEMDVTDPAKALEELGKLLVPAGD